jgi:hypothetical protein
MLAHHPITGKPIKIMKTETQLFKNQRTLLWIRGLPSSYEHPGRLQRWQTIVTDPHLALAWSSSMMQTSIVALIDATTASTEWLRNYAPRNGQLIFLSRAVITAFGGPDECKKQKFQNIVCLEEMIEIFPHTKYAYKTGTSTASVVLTISSVLRAARVFGFTPSELADPEFMSLSSTFSSAFGITVGPDATPEPLWLIQQYFIPPKVKRAKEINSALEQNSKNPLIDKILLLNEEEYGSRLPTHSNIKELNIGHRLTYADIIKIIKDYIPSGTLVAFANSDIVLDQNTWRDLWEIQMTDIFLALLRYEPSKDDPNEEPALFGPRPDSQDTWVVHSDEIKKRDWSAGFKEFEFPFGKAGCDNAVAMEMLRKKFRVANPALSMKTFHLHSSGLRTYSNDDVVEKSVFLYLEPTGIHDLEPKTDLRTYNKPWAPAQPFTRRINAVDERHAKTFCRMVSREGAILLEPDSDNLYTPQKDEHVYEFENAFVTTNGLVYGYNTMFIGQTQTIRERWSSTICSHMTPAIGVKKLLAAPLTNDVAKDTHLFISSYLSQIFRLKAHGYLGDMWLPRDAHRLQEFLQWFRWDEEVLPVLPRDSDVVGYGEKTTMITPRADDLPLREEIDALRGRCTKWSPTVVNHRRVLIVQDDTFFCDADIQALEEALEDKGYEVSVVYPSRSSASYLYQRMFSSGICIIPSGFSKLFWTLARRTRIIHIMHELELEGLSAHTAGAADLDYWLILLAGRMGKEARQKAIVERVLASVVAKIRHPDTSQEISNLVLPINQEGFHNHAGDSFREMAEIWADKGYVNIQRSTKTPYCWLGGIGKTLLYDRATPKWIQQDPAPYDHILCGNPDPKDIQGGRLWSFWPRRPRIVEEKAPVLCKKDWSERPDTLVFYGRIENEVQLKHRNNMLHKACDEFSCPVDALAQYKYTPEEYIEKLSDAKFGLCLAGYGPKCNREIECMAVGTVPIVAPDVDMVNYMVPPREGLEYIRLNSFDPEEAKVRIAAISQEEWTSMSKAAHEWWKVNASAEGMWNLTKRCIQ